MFILTEATPNPDAMKFIPHVRLTDGGGYAFHRADAGLARSALAAGLLEFEDVVSVFIAEDFLTVTRAHMGVSWSALRLPVIAAIADHLESGELAVTEPDGDASKLSGQDDLELQIQETLARWVRPGVARDGGDVLFERFDAETGVLSIRMRGACGGCPSSRLTLKAGIERIVRRYVPEVLAVEEALAPDAAHRASPVKDWIARLGGAALGGSGARPIFTHRGRPVASRESTEPATSRSASASTP